MNDARQPEATDLTSRRSALQRLFALTATSAVALPALSACGGGGAGSDPVAIVVPRPPVPTPLPTAPVPATPTATPAATLIRLKAALKQTAPTVDLSTTVTVTQGSTESSASSFGSDAQFFPALPQDANNSLANISRIYGFRRDLWTQSSGAIAGQQVVPVSRVHQAQTLGSGGRTGMHFSHTGSAFEVLVAGANLCVTLVVDNKYVGCKVATDPLVQLNSASNSPITGRNTTLKFDFGARATRTISLYMLASQGACSLVVAAGDSVTPLDRSAEASFAAITDSYGGAPTTTWGEGGLFYDAAMALGIPHLDLDAIGGTGYATNPSTPDTLLDGNSFHARLGSTVDGVPDLLVTAGSLNDNNRSALAPYASADAAKAGFAAAVSTYYTALRASLPDSVLVALGPWQPPPSLPASQSELDKATVIKAALAAAGGYWIFIDNINGGWVNSVGAAVAPAASLGPWQTLANAAQYISADNVHPNADGCAYFARRLGDDLRAAILAL